MFKFIETFPDELPCKEHFRKNRETEKIKCKKGDRSM